MGRYTIRREGRIRVKLRNNLFVETGMPRTSLSALRNIQRSVCFGESSVHDLDLLCGVWHGMIGQGTRQHS